MKITVEWKLADLWVGAFWKRSMGGILHIWICLVPCLPIHFQILPRRGVLAEIVRLYRALCRGEKKIEALQAELDGINAHPNYSVEEERRVLVLLDVIGGWKQK